MALIYINPGFFDLTAKVFEAVVVQDLGADSVELIHTRDVRLGVDKFLNPSEKDEVNQKVSQSVFRFIARAPSQIKGTHELEIDGQRYLVDDASMYGRNLEKITCRKKDNA